ncbi:MAG: helix-turn-helix domain-containing protein [Thermodesulfobacteriota bacterium]
MGEQEPLGKYLKRERENRKVSLKEVSKQIKIREPFLRAVEEDQRDALPPTTYVKGFLSAYAKYLGLDPNEVLRRYEAESKEESLLPPEVLPQRKGLGRPKYLWMIGGAIILAFVVLYHLLSPSSPPVAPPQAEPEAEKVVPEVLPPSASEKPSVLEEKGISLEIKAVERTWVEIQIDGQVARQATFQPGERFAWKAAERIELLVGNAGGLEMIFNERPLEKIGKSGEVVSVILTPQGVEVKRRGSSKPAQP